MWDSRIWDILLAPVTELYDPSNRLSCYYQLSALLFAVGFFLSIRARNGDLHPAGLLRWLFPKDVILHPSAVTDYGFFIANNMVTAAIYGTILVGAPAWSDLLGSALVALFGPPGPGVAPSHGVTLVCTLVVLVVVDGTIWWLHYLFHVVPVLWEFHKVHHSAEVLTPVSAARMHPAEAAVDALGTGFTGGAALALLNHTLGPGAHLFALYETNIFLIGFALAAFNLRHSHVYLRYPDWLQHILISPAQHQLHHSRAREHRDKNMGLVFSF